MILESSYTWSNDYVLPFESLWSLKTKFCFLNAVNWINFSQNWFLSENNLNQFIASISFDETSGKDLLLDAKNVRICPKCMKYGYHSKLHQSLLLKHCFLHPDTQLINLSEEDLNSSKNGTYAFVDIRTENLVRNSFLRKIINVYLHQRNDVIKMWIFCHRDRASVCLESTQEVVEQHYFNLLVKNSHLHKILVEINTEDVLSENRDIYEDMVKALTKKYYETDLYDSIKECEKMVRLYMELPDSEHEFIFNGLCSAFYMESFIYSKIREISISNHDIADIIGFLKSSKGFSSEKFRCIIPSLASIMSLSCMLDSLDVRDYNKLNGKWHDFGQPCSFATPIITELDGYTFYNYASNKYLEKGMLFLVKAIYEDFYYYVKQNLMYKMNNREYDGLILRELTNDLINEPEYVVIRYADRWNVYGCYPSFPSSDTRIQN